MSDNQNATPPGDGSNTPTDFSSFIPADYKDKPYMKAFKEPGDFFKQFDNLQGMIGQKLGVPGQDAPDEEWNSFFDKAGRPQDPKEYQWDKVEGFEMPPESEQKLREIMQASGLNSRQAKKLMDNYQKWTVEEIGKLQGTQAEQQKALDAEFETMADKFFGPGKKQEALETSKKLMSEFLPDELKGHLGKLDNASLMVLSTFANGMAKKYMSEDHIPKGDSNSPGAMTNEEISLKAKEIMASPEYQDITHIGHEAAAKKVKDLYARMKL